MSIEIYYFSGTGNSLAVARDIAERTGAKLISIASLDAKEHITPEADAIGIVFPVYYVGLNHIPLIVRRFVERLDNVGGRYVFAVCTYGGGGGRTLMLLDGLLRARGGRLAAGFGVQMPQNAFDKPFEDREKLVRRSKQKLAEIVKRVDARQSCGLQADGLFIKQVVDLLDWMANFPPTRPFFVNKVYRMAGIQQGSNAPFAEAMLNLDRSYHTDEGCASCGTCAKVCPVGNIKIVDGRPSWQHRCENCLACVNWCPRKAIHGYGELPKGRRYHHPEVKLADAQKQASGGPGIVIS